MENGSQHAQDSAQVHLSGLTKLLFTCLGSRANMDGPAVFAAKVAIHV